MGEELRRPKYHPVESVTASPLPCPEAAGYAVTVVLEFHTFDQVARLAAIVRRHLPLSEAWRDEGPARLPDAGPP